MNSTTSPIKRQDPEKPGFVEKLGYGMAGGANNVVWTGISTFLVYFYTDIVGIAAGLIGTIFLFSRLVDGASDVVMGVVLDKTRTRFGKARPWLLWMALPFSVVATALFAVPDASATVQIVYVIITYNIALLVYTAVEIPHGTLGALMTYDQHQRSVLNVAKMVGAYVAIIAITNITLPIVDFFGGGQAGWVYAFILFGLVAAATYFFTFWSTKERTDPVGSKQNKDRPTVKASLISLVRNKYWFIATLVLLLMYVYNAITAGVAIYYSEYVLGSPALVGLVATALTLATLGGMLLVVPITRRFGKRNTAIVGCLIAVAGSLIIFFVPDSTAVVVIGQVVRGIGKAAIMGVIFAMLADTMEYGEWKTGIRIEGLIYSGASMGIKVGTGLGSALIGWGLAASGYVGGQEIQSAESVTMISNLFIWVPTLVSVLMAVLLYFFKLDKQYPQILEELQAMKSAKA
ncbi:MFS transporter [Brevibacterium sp. UCMA 11754]|uniref:MFS transporter n=1 Tax=Brevibacterium sp. UCMA 11754 TaxID=2749198 RepID=UPI001F2BB111|nr:MFS transporter [Brevibacterium sp. UCMA 11754]MCF2572884.1 MFS transporter [Brevibacterium sp. UCMA 11754]